MPASIARGAEPPHVASLSFVRDATARACGDEEDLRSKVSTRLGYIPFRDHVDLVIRVYIRSSERGFEAVLRSETAEGRRLGERTLRSASRDYVELLESVALAISVAIDPLSLTGAPPTPPPQPGGLPPSPATPTPPAPAGTSTSPPPSAVAPAGGETPRIKAPPYFEAGLGLIGAVAAAPSPSLGFALALDIRWPRISLALEGRADLPAGSSEIEGRGVTSALRLGEAVPCLRWGPALLCVVLAAGALYGSGQGVTVTASQTTFYAATGARVGAEWPTRGPLALSASAELLAALVRTDLHLDGPTLWTTPPFSAGLGLRAIGRFQ